MFEYSLEIGRIFKWAEQEMLLLKHPYVGTEHLLLSLIKNSNEIKSIMSHYNVSYESFKDELIKVVGSASKKSEYILWTPLLKRVVNNAINNTDDLKPIDLLKSLIEEDEGIAIRLLSSMDVDLEKLYLELKNNKQKKCLELLKIGKNLQDTVDMNEIVIGRDKEIYEIIEILIRKNKNNPILVGESGVGKTAIVEELARRINNGNVPKNIKDKKIIMLDMSSLVAGTKYRGEFEEKLNNIIKELETNNDIILFIDEVHTMVNAGGAEGAINASDILKPYMARGSIHIIGATTPQEYSKFIIKDKALTRRFEMVKVSEPNIDETIDILNKLKLTYEKHYNISITEDNIKTIVEGTNKYLKNRFNPDKSIAILDSLCAKKSILDFDNIDNKLESELFKIKNMKTKMVESNNYQKAILLYEEETKIKNAINDMKKTSITNEEIIELIKMRCNINNEISQKDLYNLKKYLKDNIIGQDIALDKIINLMKGTNYDKPLSIMLTGNTGVGKTETAKQISNYLKIPLIKIDMSEYTSSSSITRLIGANAGYIGYDDEALFDKIKMCPRSIILFDEIDKCHSNIINLLLQILDEGVITNSKGEKIDFSSTYIFMTSNIKAIKKIGFVKQTGSFEEYFPKEFIARLTDIIEYNDVTKDMLKKYLIKKGINDLSILNSYDYHSLGFRGINKLIHV